MGFHTEIKENKEIILIGVGILILFEPYNSHNDQQALVNSCFMEISPDSPVIQISSIQEPSSKKLTQRNGHRCTLTYQTLTSEECSCRFRSDYSCH